MNLPLNLLVAVATIAGAGAASAQTVYIQEQLGTETIVSDPVAVTPVQRTTVYRNIIPQGGGLAPIVRERIVTERFAPVAPLAREQVVVVPRDTTYGYGTREAAYYDRLRHPRRVLRCPGADLRSCAADLCSRTACGHRAGRYGTARHYRAGLWGT